MTVAVYAKVVGENSFRHRFMGLLIGFNGLDRRGRLIDERAVTA